jgi:hypothetical protein
MDRMLARLLETSDPGLDNTVVNALDFKDRLAHHEVSAASPAFMQREIEEATQRLRIQAGDTALRPVTLGRERRALLLVTLAAVALTAFAPRLMRTVAPRFIMPWGDFPPYCQTDFDLQPGHTQVDYGANLDVSVKTSGRRPRSIALAVESLHPREVTELPLYESVPNTYLQTIERVTADLVYYARVPGGRSKQCRVRVIKTPRIDAVRVSYRYPEYTHLRPVTRHLVDGMLKGYAGTFATLLLTSNRELAGGQLRIGDRRIALRPTREADTVEAEFTINAPGTFEAFVRDVDGRASKDKVSGRIAVIPDEKPRVTIVAPQQESLATPRAQIPINVEAGDDLGVSRIVLFRNLNGSEDVSKPLYETSGPHTFVNVIETLDLADLGVKPGDEIEYYVDATDGHPNPPQSSSSPACRLTIISDEEYAKMVRTMATASDLRDKYDRLMQGLHDLAEQQARLRDEATALQKEAAKGPLGEAARRRLQDLMAQQEELEKKTEAAAARFASEVQGAPVYDVEKDYKAMLRDMAAGLQHVAQNMQESARSMAAAAAPGTPQPDRPLGAAIASQSQALKELGADEQAFDQRIAAANRDIEKLFALQSDVEVFKGLLASQKDLVRKLHSYADKTKLTSTERARLVELAEEQARIRDGLAALKEQLRAHAAGAEGNYPRVAADARGIAARIEQLEIEPRMQAASTALRKPEPAAGHQSATEAYDAMLSMVSFCEGGSGEAERECEQRLRIVMNVGLGGTFGQLARGLGNGTGTGYGIGMLGAGSGGSGSSMQMPFGLYGSSSDMLGAPVRTSTGMGRGKAQATLPDGSRPRVATSVEEIGLHKSTTLQVELPAGEQIVEEYRSLILQYFRGLAEEAP